MSTQRRSALGSLARQGAGMAMQASQNPAFRAAADNLVRLRSRDMVHHNS